MELPAFLKSCVGLFTGAEGAKRISKSIIVLSFSGLVGPLIGIVAILCEGQSRLTFLFCAGATFAVGFLGGFLFAIPKVLQGQPEGQIPSGEQAGSNTKGKYGQLVNTNLEQISDWLCKIIVGLGLYELRNIPAWVGEVGLNLSTDLGDTALRSFAIGIMIYFVALGFFSGYLLTRLVLAPEFAQADLKAISPSLEEELENLDKSVIYTKALTMGLLAAEEKYDASKALQILKRAREAGYFPEDRHLAIIEARVYRWGKKDIDEAINVLTKYLRFMLAKPNFSNEDHATVLFNRACYYYVKAKRAEGEDKNGLIQSGIEDLRSSIAMDPQNAAAARDDDDFKPLDQEPDFKRVVGTQ